MLPIGQEPDPWAKITDPKAGGKHGGKVDLPSRLRARVARTTHTHHPYNDKCLAFHGTSACVSMDTPLRVLGWNICVCLDGYKSACVSISWNICTCSRMEHLCVSRWNICVCSMCSTRMLGVAKLHLATSWTLIAGTLCSTGGNTGPYARSSSWRAGAPMCLWRHHATEILQKRCEKTQAKYRN